MTKDAVDRELEDLVRGMRAVRRKHFIASCVAMGAAVPTALASGLLLALMLRDATRIPVVAFFLPFVIGGIVFVGLQRRLAPKDADEVV
jgi:hypothetical protein